MAYGEMGAGMNALPDIALQCDNLTLGYNRHPAVHHLDCRIGSGALVAIVGPNGAGKSTLLKALTGELPPLQGSFSIGECAARVAYLPQQNEIDRSFPVSVFDMVAMGLWREIGAFHGLDRRQNERIRQTLALVGLSGMERRPIGTLSGGQLQRARFARLMLQDANLLLLDEPFNAVDARTTDDLIALLLSWHAEGRTILAVLHDLERVRRYFPHSLLLAREALAFGPTSEVLTDTHLALARDLSERFEEDSPVCQRPPSREVA